MILDADWELSELNVLRGCTLEWISDDELIASRRNRLFRVAWHNNHWSQLQPYGEVPLQTWKELAGQFRLAARLLRLSFYNILRLGPQDWFYTFDRSIGRLTNGQSRPITGIVRPMRVLRGGCCLTASGNVLFGEYVGNHQRDSSIRLYRYDTQSEQTTVVHEFPAGQIRHLHGIYQDTHEPGTYWALSGDLPDECRVMRTRDEFRTLEIVGTGDETWRAVSACFVAKAIYYGMDAEFVQNALYRLDRQTGERTKLAELGGPVYYSASTGADHFFGVTAELCPSQRDPFAELWHVGADEQAKCILKIAKDRWPVSYFQAGHFQFPQGPGRAQKFYFSVLGLAGADGRVYQLQRHR